MRLATIRKIWQISFLLLCVLWGWGGVWIVNAQELPPSPDATFHFLDKLSSDSTNAAQADSWFKSAYKQGNLLHRSSPDSALFHFKAIVDHSNFSLLNDSLEAILVALLANQYKRLGQFNKALYHFEAAINLCEVSGLRNGFAANIYHYTGNIYTRKGNYERALYFLNHSLAIRKTLNDQNQIAKSYSDLGLIYRDLGDVEQASLSFYKALKLSEVSIKQKGTVLLNLAELQLQMGNPALAETTAQKAKKHLEKADYRAGVGAILQLLGKIKEQQGDWDQSLSFYELALQEMILARGKYHREVAMIYFDRYETYLKKGEEEKAFSECTQALYCLIPDWEASIDFDAPAEELLYPEPWLITTMNALAQHLSQDSIARSTALRFCQRSIKVMELLRQHYSDDRDRSHLIQNHFEVFDLAIELALELATLEPAKAEAYRKTAFQIAEQSKALNLFEAITQSRARLASQLPDSLLEAEIQLQSKIRKAKSEQERPKEELFELTRSYDRLIQKIEKDHPSYFQLKYGPPFIPLEAIQSKLSTNELLIEFQEANQKIHLFALTKDTLIVSSIDKGKLSEPVTILQKAISKAPNLQLLDQSIVEFIPSARSVYDILFEAILSSVSGISEIILVPDGNLDYIPFELCLSPQINQQQLDFRSLPYLFRKYAISYHYSASVIAQTRTIQQLKSKRDYSMLAMAPASGERLQGTLEELDYLASRFQGSFLSGASASKDAFLAQAKEHAFIHLATHGKVDLQNPMHSGLLFRSPESADDAQYLQAYEVYGMNLDAQLIVLSACETGFGKEARGEGVMSLGRSFLYAGSSGVIQSLWRINDATSSKVIAEFYHQADQPQSLAQSLRLARLNYLDRADALTAHPYYWAGFIAMGESVPIPTISASSNWPLPAIILASALFLLFVWRLLKKRSKRMSQPSSRINFSKKICG